MSDIVPNRPPRVLSALPTPRAAAVEQEIEPALEPVDLKEIISTLQRRIWLVAAVAAMSVGIAALVAITDEPLYRAYAVIRLTDSRRAMTGGIDDPAMAVAQVGWTDPVQSQLQVLQSRSVAAEVVKNQALGLRVVPVGFNSRVLSDVRLVSDTVVDTVYVSFGANELEARADDQRVVGPYGAPLSIGGVSFRVTAAPSKQASGSLVITSTAAAINQLVGHLSAKQRKLTDVIDVDYTAHDPFIAQQVVNAVVATFQSLNAETAQLQSRRRRLFLAEQLKQTDSLLVLAQDALSSFRSHKQVYGSDLRIQAQQSGLLDLQTQRQQMVADRDVAQQLFGRLQASGAPHDDRMLRALISTPAIAANPLISQLFNQLVEYEAARDSLTLGPWGAASSNPDVKRLDGLIANVQTHLADAVTSHLAAMNARIAALDQLRAANAADLQRLPPTQAAEARLEQQVEATGKLADQLREEYQKARIAEAVEAGQVEIVDLADKSSHQIGMRTRVKLALGLVLGLVFGAGAALVLERLNTSIRRRDEIESLLQLPGLAIIPQIAPARNGRLGRLKAKSIGRGSERRSMNENGTSLVTISDVRSTGAEAFRTLRTNLIFSQAVQTLRRIIITSPSPQDGKTTTAANLAVTFAQQGLRVLLIDCDLRRGRLNSMFHSPREPGLTQLIVGQAAASDVIRPTSVDGLFFISSGTFPPNPSELLGGSQTRDVLDKLGAEFDVLILDTPPVHAAADAMVLGSVADGVILVLRAGHTERHSAQDALQRLQNVGARVVGAVLNDPDHKVPQYGGYYYYDYYHEEKQTV